MKAGAPEQAGGCRRDVLRARAVDALVRKGYSPDAMGFDETFRLATDEGEVLVPVEIVVRIQGRPFLLVKCIDGSPSSREQASLALARLYPGGPVPYAVVAGSEEVLVLDAGTRKTLGRGPEAIPEPPGDRFVWEGIPPAPDPGAREREKRILTAYYHLRCPVPKEPF